MPGLIPHLQKNATIRFSCNSTTKVNKATLQMTMVVKKKGDTTTSLCRCKTDTHASLACT